MGMLKEHPDFTKGKRTKKVPKQETDVNQIVKRFEKTGQLPPARQPGAFADVSAGLDLRESLEKLQQIKTDAEKRIRILKAKEKRDVELSKKVDAAKGTPDSGSSGGVGEPKPTGSGSESRESASDRGRGDGRRDSDGKDR